MRVALLVLNIIGFVLSIPGALCSYMCAGMITEMSGKSQVTQALAGLTWILWLIYLVAFIFGILAYTRPKTPYAYTGGGLLIFSGLTLIAMLFMTGNFISALAGILWLIAGSFAFAVKPALMTASSRSIALPPVQMQPQTSGNQPGNGNATAECPFCKEDILPGALKCKHCGSMLNQTIVLNTTPTKHRGSSEVLQKVVMIFGSFFVLFVVLYPYMGDKKRTQQSVPATDVNASTDTAADWKGGYEHGANLGQTAGGSAIFITYQIEITDENALLGAIIRADGYQTNDEIHCDTKSHGNHIELYFNSYPDGSTKKSEYAPELYKKGDLLLSLDKVTNNGRDLYQVTWEKYNSDVKEKVFFEKKNIQVVNKAPNAIALSTPNVIGKEEIEMLLNKYVALGSESDYQSLSNLLALYADQVNYYKSGTVNKAIIAKDKKAYYARWPIRRYSIVQPIQITPGQDNEMIVDFKLQFDVSNSSKSVRGIAENHIVLRKVNDVSQIIVEQGRVIGKH